LLKKKVTEMNDSQHERNYLKTLARGFQVLAIFTPEKPEASLTELAEALDSDASTASRFAYTLEKLGYLERDEHTKLYQVSPKIFALTVSLSGPRNIRKVSLPYMEELRDTTGETVVLGVRDGAEIVVIEVVETRHALVPRGWVGGRVPVYSSALGKALLVHLQQPELTRLLDNISLVAHTEHTIVNRFNLLKELDLTRERGWSINNEEYTRGIVSVGAPIYSGRRAPSGAICVDVPTARIPDNEYIQQLAAEVKKTAAAISRLGIYRQMEPSN
jgi:DNA-binding IclR family transcriptional regulator